MTEECVFCRIVRGEIPATFVYEDDQVVAFPDARRVAPVHILVIPRKHVPAYLANASEEDKRLFGHLASVAAHVALEQGVAESGYRTVVNRNSDAGQSVDHLHLHVLGGKFMGWPPFPNE